MDMLVDFEAKGKRRLLGHRLAGSIRITIITVGIVVVIFVVIAAGLEE